MRLTAPSLFIEKPQDTKHIADAPTPRKRMWPTNVRSPNAPQSGSNPMARANGSIHSSPYMNVLLVTGMVSYPKAEIFFSRTE